MVATVLKLVGFDLQRQVARLKAQAEEFKDRTLDDIKHKAVNTGLMIGLAFGGLVFVLITLVVGLMALYLWVEMHQGPFVALGAVALATALLAALMFTVAATRGGSTKSGSTRPESKPKPRQPILASDDAAKPVHAEAPQPASRAFAATPGAQATASLNSLVDTLTQDLTSKASAVANEAMDSAVDTIRKSPREAILAAMAVAVVAGVFIGRRRV